jgi:hypothetical protein
VSYTAFAGGHRMHTLGYKIIRHLVDWYDVTEQEAIGMARYLLWLQIGRES